VVTNPKILKRCRTIFLSIPASPDVYSTLNCVQTQRSFRWLVPVLPPAVA